MDPNQILLISMAGASAQIVVVHRSGRRETRHLSRQGEPPRKASDSGVFSDRWGTHYFVTNEKARRLTEEERRAVLGIKSRESSPAP